MGSLRRITAGVAAIATICAFAAPQVAGAQPYEGAQFYNGQSTKVKELVDQLDAALIALGCNATLDQDIKAIETTITNSGDDPSTVQAALTIVSASRILCPGVKPALASVDNTVLESLQGTFYATSNGPGPGIPIGPPPAYFGAGGSDYQPH